MSNITITPNVGSLSLTGAAGLMNYALKPGTGSLALGSGFAQSGAAPIIQPSLIGPVHVGPGNPGGVWACYNITGAIVVKSTPGVLCTIACTTTGNITLNDCISTSYALAGNKIGTFDMTTGQTPITLNWPCSSGIVVSAVSAGVFSISFT